MSKRRDEEEEEEEDELDLYMKQLEVPRDFVQNAPPPQSITLEEIYQQQEAEHAPSSSEQVDAAFFTALLAGDQPPPAGRKEEGDEDEDYALLSEETSTATLGVMEMIAQKAKKKEIKRVAHGELAYPAFRKDFYIESADISSKSDAQVAAERDELEITVRGKRPIPRPISRWEECGLGAKTMELLAHHGWAKPFAVQRQALPCIMSGRDVVGIASTGSGKTLAFVIPMLRHIRDQAKVSQGQGPIALIIAPARELATQIQREVLKFKQVDCACLYGGQNVGDQIRDLKKGNECVVGTPGRIIDVLATQGGRLLPLNRVTFVVLDEADRLFDMGFTPQVERILCNVRPDRQTVMFSATFPHHVEKLAKETLQANPLVITVGNARSGAKASADITQLVELRSTEQEKFLRLLQLLGEWYARGGCVLVFCDSQVHVDALYTELERAGYPSLTLHAGKDQLDRDSALKDFKSKDRRVMVATGVAGRGLDVADLNLVVNYNAPNHVEEYVHRIGRTGRAGRKGTAITFVSDPEDAKYAGDLVFALRASDQPVPEFLTRMADEFAEKVSAGVERKHASGYRTKGFTFEADEEASTAKKMRSAYYEREIKQHEKAEGEEEQPPSLAPSPTPPPAPAPAPVVLDARQQQIADDIAKAKALAGVITPANLAALAATAKPSAAAAAAATSTTSTPVHTMVEIDINDLPAAVRMRVASKRATNSIESEYRVSLTVKGSYFPPGKAPSSLERKLHMVIESRDAQQVELAVQDFHRLLAFEVSKLSADQAADHVGGASSGSRYRV